MRVFKTKWFARFARKERINDAMLIDAVREVEEGLNDGELGGGLVKKRVGRAGQGKRGGHRTIIVHRAASRSVFLYGFTKSAKANLSATEVNVYRKLAGIYLDFSDADMARVQKEGEVEEVEYRNEEEIPE